MRHHQPAEYGISQLARDSGISARTLRHYDAIGLLAPSFTATNGYRFYGRPEVLRLQRILLLRELGLSLETIASVLDGQQDELKTLAAHAGWLDAERDRLAAMAASVRETIAHLQSGEDMDPVQAFDGFEANPYEAEARTRWGDRAVEESNTRLRALGPEGQARLLAEHERIADDLFAALGAGLGPEDDAVQAVIARHHAWVCHSWTPSAEAYAGLGEMYVADARFTASYDAPKNVTPRPGVAELLAAAIAHYAAASPERFER
ncbi:TipAS antibiotic-recognition domain-containing protein [Paeniglutamicibacter sp. NPDC012692]|uniref:MerR family transcriptional regulator n=1 Tax=Paeniglutamicibacter sp. NPDC012692 TaxID=3364388 RepID=UPI0036A9D048